MLDHRLTIRLKLTLYAPQVQFGEYAGPTEFLEGGWDQGKWIRQLHCLWVQGSVVDAWPQASVYFAHEEKAGGSKVCRLPDESLLESLLDLILHCLALWDGQRVNSTLWEFSLRQQVNGTVPWPMRWEASGCLLAEYILERLVVRWDRTLHQRLRTFDEGGTHLDLQWFPEWFRDRGQTVLEAGLAPASDLTRIPSDFWRMLVEPGHPRMISTVGPSSTRN